MSGPANISARALITGLIVAAALVIAWSSRREIIFLRAQIKTRHTELAQIAAKQAEAARQRAPLDWIETRARPGDTVADLIQRHLGTAPTDLALRERRDDENGWSHQRYDLRIDRASPAALGAFLAACENARPPVRLVDIQVSAAATPDPQITAQLALAELTRKTPVSAP